MRRDHELAHRVWLAIFVAAAVLTVFLVVTCSILNEGGN